MGVNYFTDEQVKYLNKNPNVKKASIKAITYEDGFKEHFTREYDKGILPREIFEKAGLPIEILGQSRIEQSTDRFKKFSNRLFGFKDTRSGNFGKSRHKELTDKEVIERQKLEIEYLKQEREFLLELKRLERQAIKKSLSKPKKNTKL